jgi:diacylglycerol kinase (ATP)
MAPRHDRVRQVQQSLQVPTGRLPQPTLILLSGLPGTGKSYLAQQLARRLPLVVVASDRVRRLLFPEPAYTPDEHYIVHSTCQEVVAALLRGGYGVIFDATNLIHSHRQRYYSLAAECGAQLLILQTTASPEMVRQRLQERAEGLQPAHGSSADWGVYLDYAEKIEPIRRPHRVVDTSGDISTVIGEVASQLEGVPAPLPPHPRTRLILNPAAGQSYRLAELDETIGYLVRQGWELSLVETHRPGEASELARQAAAEGLDLVLALGGDGTVNEVVNGLAGTPTALGVIPMGSGNVWAREQGLPTEPEEAARVLVHGQIRPVDLGLAGTRYFLLMASVGFDAAITQSLSREAKQALWPLGYIVKGITEAIDFAGEEAQITLDDRQVVSEMVLAVIGNTRLYGGFAQITPHASIDDGLLDVCVLYGRGGLPLISAFALVSLFQRPDLITGMDSYRAREVTISTQTPLFVQADGDPIGTTPMTFKAVPRGLRVLVPREVSPGLFTHP